MRLLLIRDAGDAADKQRSDVDNEHDYSKDDDGDHGASHSPDHEDSDDDVSVDEHSERYRW